MSVYGDIQEHVIRLNRLELNDFRGFGFLDIAFHENMTVLIADNGGGKTTILEGIAKFLQYLYFHGIRGRGPKKEKKYNLSETDILNDRNVSVCKADFDLSYQFPSKKIFALAQQIASYLNEFELLGEEAILQTISENEEESNAEKVWRLIIDEEVLIELEEAIVQELVKMTEKQHSSEEKKQASILDEEDSFKVAYKEEGIWQANLQLSSKDLLLSGQYQGHFSCSFELNRSGLSFQPEWAKSSLDVDAILQSFDERIAFLEDYHSSLMTDPKHTSYPLLVYYGCKSINPRVDKVDIKYRPRAYQAYKGAFDPDRFEFESFVEWFHSLFEPTQPSYILERVLDTMLEVLNAAGETYSDIRIENGNLTLSKQIDEAGTPVSLSFGQLSTGEKNIFALIGDLTRRAIELNPVLFDEGVDSDVEGHSFTNPLRETHGIVLIDEIDLHLHPRWQRAIVPQLRKLFPRVQFVVATHSVLVLQEADGFVYKLTDGVPERKKLFGGWTFEEIFQEMGLEEDFGQKYRTLLNEFFEAYKLNDVDEASEKLDELKEVLPSSGDTILSLTNRLKLLKEDW